MIELDHQCYTHSYTHNISTIELDSGQNSISISQIEENLFIGNEEAALNLNPKINLVISLMTTDLSKKYDGVEYFQVPIEDEPAADMYSPLVKLLKKIFYAVGEGKNVLVHCEKGVSRSASVVTAFLMVKYNLSLKSALAKLQQHHECADPNIWFHDAIKRAVQDIRVENYTLKNDFLQDPWKPGQRIEWNIYREIRPGEGRDIGYTEDGHWGKGAAGILVVDTSKEPKKVHVFRRSPETSEPNLLSIPGGARQVNFRGDLNDPLVTALQEYKEEAGPLPFGVLNAVPVIYKKTADAPPYHTFILETQDPELFSVKLNWEHTESFWLPIKEVLSRHDVHPGLKSTLQKVEAYYHGN